MVNQDRFQVIPLFICEITQLHCFNEIFKGKTAQLLSLIAQHFPGTVTDFATFSLPPQIAFYF
jgi:hypothetical protein